MRVHNAFIVAARAPVFKTSAINDAINTLFVDEHTDEKEAKLRNDAKHKLRNELQKRLDTV